MTLTDDEILARVEGQTVPTAFMATVAAYGDHVATAGGNSPSTSTPNRWPQRPPACALSVSARAIASSS